MKIEPIAYIYLIFGIIGLAIYLIALPSLKKREHSKSHNKKTN